MAKLDQSLPKLLNYYEAAEILNIAPITLRKWVSAGAIPSVKIGFSVRFLPEQLEQFIKASIRDGGVK